MNRSLSVALLATVPAALRSESISDNVVARWVRRTVERRRLSVDARCLTRAERDAACVALLRDGISNGRDHFGDAPPTASGHAGYDVLRQIR